MHQHRCRVPGVTVAFAGDGAVSTATRRAVASACQQLAAAATLFGAGAARQMTAIIAAGMAAYDKATAWVSKLGAAHDAAAKQADTLHVEEGTLEAEMADLATKVGEVLIPILTAMIGVFVRRLASSPTTRPRSSRSPPW